MVYAEGGGRTGANHVVYYLIILLLLKGKQRITIVAQRVKDQI